MENPALYDIGIKDECFSTKLFIWSALRGFFHGMIIFISLFWNLSECVQTKSDGQAIGLDGAGNVLYGGVVIGANVILFENMNTHNW